jgi:hypothetical protein
LGSRVSLYIDFALVVFCRVQFGKRLPLMHDNPTAKSMLEVQQAWGKIRATDVEDKCKRALRDFRHQETNEMVLVWGV